MFFYDKEKQNNSGNDPSGADGRYFDQDHVGGAETLIESMDVERVLVPDYEGTSTEYQDFMIALEEKGMTAERLKKQKSLNWAVRKFL
nr:hypothetical protein [uncultured Blautia sp.]